MTLALPLFFGLLPVHGASGAQLAYLAALLGAAFGFSRLRSLDGLLERQVRLKRFRTEAVTLVAAIGLSVLLACLGSILPGSAPDWPWGSLLLTSVHTLALSLALLRVGLSTTARGMMLVGIGWVLPSLSAEIGALGLQPFDLLKQTLSPSLGQSLPAVGLLLLSWESLRRPR